MRNPNREAWDTLTEKDFIHSCDCIVCKSLRDDSGRSCSGCAEHHILNKTLRANEEEIRKALGDSIEREASLRSAKEAAESSATLFRERYELEQIRYEGISGAIEELREEAKRLREELRTGLAMTTCPACGSETAKTNEPRLNLENKRLREAVEWAIDASLQVSKDINSGMVEQFSADLRRRADAGREGK